MKTLCIYVIPTALSQTAITSLFNINKLVLITETERVYCAVRAGFLHVYNSGSFQTPRGAKRLTTIGKLCG